eukprot:Pgem_evm1s10719
MIRLYFSPPLPRTLAKLYFETKNQVAAVNLVIHSLKNFESLNPVVFSYALKTILQSPSHSSQTIPNYLALNNDGDSD